MGVLDQPPYGPVEVGQTTRAVVKILQDAGVDPSPTDLLFFRGPIASGMRHGLSPHEIVAFVARDWPDRPPESAKEAERLSRAVMSAVGRKQARSTMIAAVKGGLDMAHAAARVRQLGG